jgi:DNA processing protein
LRVDRIDLIALTLLPVSRLRAAAAFKEIRQEPDLSGDAALETLMRVCALPEHEHGATAADVRQRARQALDAAASAAMDILPWHDDRYPVLLDCTPDPPPVLWVQGNVDLLAQPGVAIVGSRAASTYAIDVAQRLGQDLARRGLVVTSGLARGVDSAAHTGCLATGGRTIAVLGSGLDYIYPREHAPLAASILEKGLLVSELAPGVAPRPEHFPLRNRIISGISLGVVVVEASENSGSLITARYALEHGRDVMAVPGSVLSGRNSGSHRLLKDGAKVVESADDILDELGWPTAAAVPESAPKYLKSDRLLSVMEAGEVYRLDELMELTGVTGTRLLPRLMELELAGLVMNTGSGFSRRLVT